MKVGTDGILLGAWFHAMEEVKAALDVGTGCGLIALMLAQRFPNWQLTGIEIAFEAAKTAEWNRQQSPWADRIQVVADSLQDHSKTGRTYDAIACNPPFFRSGVLSQSKERRTARHQENLDPMTFFASCRQLSHERTRISIIVPAADRSIWETAGRANRFQICRRTDVIPLPGKPVKRCLLELQTSPCPAPRIEQLVLELEHHSRTPEFQALTRDFYLR